MFPGIFCPLVLICLAGCNEHELAGLEEHEFRARLLSDGSLKLEFFRNAKLSEEALVSSDRISPANSISATHYDRPGLGPWCVVECHINPSTSMIVAWNPQTNAVYCSPGYTWGMISTYKGNALVTIFRPHLNTPPDASDMLYVNEVELAALPAYKWTPMKSDVDRAEFQGTSHLDEPMFATVLFSGRWNSPAGREYDVFYVDFTLRRPVRHSNVKGVHRVFFVRNGEVVQSTTCSNEIVVQDNQLLEMNDGGAAAPWSEADMCTKDL